MREHVDELEQEQKDLESLLRSLSEQQWGIQTQAVGWDVKDQVSHLADTEEIAYDTVTGGPRPLNDEALKYESPEAFTEAMCDKGRSMQPGEVLQWWLDGSEKLRATLLTLDEKQRIPWGLGMSARAFVTARLMEHWAHGLDIRAAVGKPPNITPRLKNIAWLVTNAANYAFAHAGRTKPEGTLRVVLQAPDGGSWSFGPNDATDEITGDAAEYCILGVQRMKLADVKTLKARGPLAEQTLEVLRAFL
ncbi:MAG: maleylpyruvate isomerase family mycothiol-dependent enzyme [Actinomycetota bacterium]